MEYALFLGCKIPHYAPQYETATRAVCSELKVGLANIEFNCCGYPVRHLDFDSYLVSSARNLALAESRNLDIITPCKCCYGSLKKAIHLLKENGSLREKINRTLGEQGLAYEGKNTVRHILQVFYHEVGTDTIKKMVTAPFEGLKIAAHYGCHALRPSNIMEFDDPAQPRIFDRLVEVTGAKSVDWPLKTQCCGNPLWGKNDAMSKALTEKKLVDAKQAGADYLCVACTYCQIQFDTVQDEMLREKGRDLLLPSILYPQLLGLSMGIEPEKLGMSDNILSIESISSFAHNQNHSESSAHPE